MAYHDSKGQEFLGLRTNPRGKREIIYDSTVYGRTVIRLVDQTIDLRLVDEALAEGIVQSKVFCGLLLSLQSRQIGFEL